MGRSGPRAVTAESSPVAAYYERNTSRFLRFGGGAGSGAIHRQLWGPGVTSVAQAAAFIHHELAAAVAVEPQGERSVVLDLGCGVGGTAIHLARAFPAARVHGVTISATQSQLAREAAAHAGVSDNCAFHVADFEQWRADVRADVALAI
jgi:cyclopropane fatty-acyl-phospholipid synthase-like methyltransferase